MATEYFTEEGLKKLKEELQHLVSVERPSISNQIAEARDKGDLSENAEYDAAKEAQGLLELKISLMEQTLRNAKLIDETKLDASKILILHTGCVMLYRASLDIKYIKQMKKEFLEISKSLL
jgi:transcription elongation factor GreA